MQTKSNDIKYSTVTEFSKKTGDYPSLSAADIQVIALTYQLEKEKVGIDHLHESPVQKNPIIEPKVLPPDAKKIAGFYAPKKVRYDLISFLWARKKEKVLSSE